MSGGNNGRGIPLIRGNLTKTLVNGVEITHYADPRAAPTEEQRLVSCLMVWNRGLEQRVALLERATTADRRILTKVAERAGIDGAALRELVIEVGRELFAEDEASEQAAGFRDGGGDAPTDD